MWPEGETDGPGPGAGLRHDGFYVLPQPDDAASFLRFFPGNRVVACTIGDERPPEEFAGSVARWMVPGRPGPQHGVYELEGAELRFAAVGDAGTVDYRGVVAGGGLELRLRTHSLINGHRSRGTWRFLPLPGGPPTPGES
ncbi:hypothetical protein ACIBF1_28465 [Spirillospora sp. NPDC050679]